MNLTNLGFMETKILNPNPNPNSSYLTFGKEKFNTNNLNDHIISDEDEPGFGFDQNSENLNRSKGRKCNNNNNCSSRWQRMKWSDSRVRLLIQVVSYVGDDDGTNDATSVSVSRKCLHKKGKWKTVSRIMGSKGCQVSPQQCEDKFNDLNKRYKRLNDILGRGVSCRVVENPGLMESMPRLSSKMKEDVRKILSSKHLFYPEMCAYHNGQRIPNCEEVDDLQAREFPVVGQRGSKENADDVEDHDETDEDEDEDEEDDGEGEGERVAGHKCFMNEMNEFFADPNNSKVEKKLWVGKRMLQLSEQRVRLETEGFEMEKRRFKWERFCDKKDREIETARLENERLMLEKEHMVLQLKSGIQVVDSD